MRRVWVIGSVLLLLAGCLRGESSLDPAEALKRIGQTECVERFEHDAEPWTIEIDPQCDDLKALGETLFSLVNDAGRDGKPEVMIVHGPWKVPVEYEHDHHGRQPGPAAGLRTSPWCRGRLPISERR